MQALKLVSTKDLQHDDWLDWRRKGIGGSDVSAICNMNRYRSPMAVYLDKTGQLPPLEDNEFMYWGRELEDTVAREFSKRTGYKVRRENQMLQHPQHSFMLANVDRLIVGQNAGLECKTASEYAKQDWIGESVPKEYALQCHHYMACTGTDRWYVAVLIGGNKFEWRVIERDEVIIESLINLESDFWHNHVLANVPPAYGAHDTTLLGERFTEARDNERIDLTPFRDDVLGLIEARNNYVDAKHTFEDYKNRIKGHMEFAEYAVFNDELMFTWKNTKKSRTFRIIGADE
jgi:putative phage-type endonuclease